MNVAVPILKLSTSIIACYVSIIVHFELSVNVFWLNLLVYFGPTIASLTNNSVGTSVPSPKNSPKLNTFHGPAFNLSAI